MTLTKEQIKIYTEELKDGFYEFIRNSIPNAARIEVVLTALDILTEKLLDKEYENLILETCQRLKEGSYENIDTYYKPSDINYVSEEFIDNLVKKWDRITNEKSGEEFTASEINLFCYHDKNKFVAVDNTNKQCFVEEFYTEICAVNYLIGNYYDLEELYKYDEYLYKNK